MTGKRYLCARCGSGLNNDQITHHGGLCCFCSEDVEREVHHGAEATAAAEQRLRTRIEALPSAEVAVPITDMHGQSVITHPIVVSKMAVLALLDTPAPASPRQGEPVERVEVRNNPDGTVDEVLFYVGDRCVFHLEQMDTGRWWFALYPKDDDEGAHFDVGSTRRVWVADRSDPMTYPASMRSPAALSEPAEAGEPAVPEAPKE